MGGGWRTGKKNEWCEPVVIPPGSCRERTRWMLKRLARERGGGK